MKCGQKIGTAGTSGWTNDVIQLHLELHEKDLQTNMNPSWRTWLITGGSMLSIALSSIAVSACDPLGCLLIGKDQDALFLITVTRTEKQKAVARVEHTYARKSPQPDNRIQIKLSQDTSWNPFLPDVGDYYFVSLACPERVCSIKWGAWKVDGPNYRTAKLLKIRHGDDAAIQWFLNGNGSEVYGVENKMFAKTPSGDIEIYPHYPSITPSRNLAHLSSSMAYLVVPMVVPLLIYLLLQSLA